MSDGDGLRLVFMGTSSFAVPSLKSLVDAGHQVELVVTQPDRPSGRGRNMLVEPPVKKVAVELGIPVFQPERIRDESAVDQIRKLAPLDAIVVAAFGQIVPQEILDIPRMGCVNVHGALLPKYRGAAPIQRAIMAGETRTGVTTMLMDAGIDTGCILLQREVEIGELETAGELESRLAEIGAELLLETLRRMALGEVELVQQDDSLATYAKSIKREEGRIDWRKSGKEIVNLVRALSPKPGAFTSFRGREIKIWRVAVLEESCRGEAGEIVEVCGQYIKVAAVDCALAVLEVQPEGRKRMSGGDFARGFRISVGERFE
jgi:methionyl-tRNA formyltransferase